MKIFYRWLALSLVLASTAAPAQDPLRAILEKPCNSSDYPGSNVVVLFDSTKADVQESGLSYVHMHKLIRILTPEGAKQNSVIRIDYDPLSAHVDILEAKVYKKDGAVITLDVSKTLDYPAPARAIYWGAREKMLEAGRMEPGDALQIKLFRKGFTYALLYDDDDRYIPPMRGHFYDIVPFWSSDHIVEKVYQVALPEDKFLQFEFYNGEVRTSVVLKDNKRVYTFTKSDFSRPATEPGMVDFFDEFPKLLMSTSPDWYAKSVWFYNVNEDYGSFAVTPEIQAKVDELLQPAQNEMDSVSILTHWVADNIRYSGISMGEGEGYTLHTGEMTFTDRCGVCKDKASMLITMLRAAGFESYAAMTMAGSRIEYIPADHFNHSITVVKLSDGEYHLLDPTWVPFVRELWSSLEQQQNYLMGLPEGADLMITPVSPPENHYLRIKGVSELSADGTLTGEITIDAEGQSDAAIRRMFTSGYMSTWEQSLERELISVFPRAIIRNMTFNSPYDYLAEPLHITYSYTIPDFAVVTGSEIVITPAVFSGLFKRAMSHLNFRPFDKERRFEFRDRCSRLVELSEEITLPFQANISYAPDLTMVSGEAGSFKGGYSVDGSRLSVTATVKLNKRVYKPEEWDVFYQVVYNQKKMADEPVILNK